MWVAVGSELAFRRTVPFGFVTSGAATSTALTVARKGWATYGVGASSPQAK